MNMNFKEFVINENKAYLGQKIGDILNALQDLQDSADGMGTRNLVKNSENIVNQIRRILHSKWGEKEEYSLKKLQKCGVAIMKAIDQKSDLREVIKSCMEELQNLLGDIDMPVNRLASPASSSETKEEPETLPSPPKGNEKQKQSGVAQPPIQS